MMEEEPQIETLDSLPPHRRRCLKSETHRILFRILSHCRDVSQLSDQNVPPEINQDNGSSELEEATEKEGVGNVELDELDRNQRDDSAAQQELVVNEGCDTNGLLEVLFSEEGNEDFSGAMEVMDFGIDFGDLELGPEEVPMDELEQIMNGNDESTVMPLIESLVVNEGENDKGVLLSNQEQCDDSLHKATVGLGNEGESDECTRSLLKSKTLVVEPMMQQQAMETSVSSGGAEESLFAVTEVAGFEVPEPLFQKVPEVFGFSMEKDIVGDASKPSESTDRILFQKANVLEGEHEMQPKEKKIEIVCTRNTVNSPNYMNDDEDMEEGEISDDYGMDDRSTDVLFHDTVRSEENTEVRILKDVDDPREHSGMEEMVKEFDSNSFLRSIADRAQNPRVELRECRTKPIGSSEVVQGKTMEAMKEGGYEPLLESRRIKEKDSRIIGFQEACTDNQASHKKISENNEAESCGTTYEDKGDAGAPNKRKRGPPSKEKKQRKKAKERKKRAEMNRQQGVQRPKLHFTEKPKAKQICRHYYAGKCYEGDKCKFSHDVVPSTKSTTPCSHFARNSCMKGDDCIFDHQLSKYPCDKFVNNGFCIRGDRCLFSHKILSKEGATATSKPELVPPSVQSGSMAAHVKNGSPSQKNSNALPHSTGARPHNNTELTMARTLLEQPTMSTKGFSFLFTGKPSLVHSGMSKQGVSTPDRNTGAKARNLMQQSPSSSVPSTKENIMTTPAVVTPKGINFLSFGKASPYGSSGKNQDRHQTGQCVSETVQNLNPAPMVFLPAEPKAADLLSAGKAPLANSSVGNPFNLTSTSDNGNSTHSGEGKSAFFETQNSNAISSRLLPSLLTSGQSSDYTASRFKDTVNQRALSSTLAFAAKYESKKTNQSTGSTFTHIDRETKQNESRKAFDIFNFLSSIGNTTMQ